MRTHSLSEPMGVATARIPFEAPRTFNAPLFHSLVAGLGEDRRWVILDLGSARPQTVSLLSRFRCRLDIVDLADSLERRRERLAGNAAAAKIFLHEDGSPYREGERLVQADLAWTLGKIAGEGVGAFYEGEIAERIAADMQVQGGPMTLDDLKAGRVVGIPEPA